MARKRKDGIAANVTRNQAVRVLTTVPKGGPNALALLDSHRIFTASECTCASFLEWDLSWHVLFASGNVDWSPQRRKSLRAQGWKECHSREKARKKKAAKARAQVARQEEQQAETPLSPMKGATTGNATKAPTASVARKQLKRDRPTLVETMVRTLLGSERKRARTKADSVPKKVSKDNHPGRGKVAMASGSEKADTLQCAPGKQASPAVLLSPHPIYQENYWLATDDFVYIRTALVGNTMTGPALAAPFSPGNFHNKMQMVLANKSGPAVRRQIVGKSNSNNTRQWKHAICNTSNGAGVHWVLLVYCVAPTLDLFILDPYEHTAHLKLLKQLFPEAQTIGMGHQAAGDWWRCGYIVLWWHLFCYSYMDTLTEGDTFDPDILPAYPSRWEELCWLMLRASDTQRHMLSHHGSTFELEDTFKEVMETRDAGNVIDTLQRRLYELRYPRGKGCGWAVGDYVCAVFNHVDAESGERPILFEGRVLKVIGSRVRVHWTSDQKKDNEYAMDDVHATPEAAFAATREEDLRKRAEAGPSVRTRGSMKLQSEEKANPVQPKVKVEAGDINISVPQMKPDQVAKVKQEATQKEQNHLQKKRSTLRMCRVTGDTDEDSDKGAHKRSSLMIMGQSYYYPLQAQKHTYRVADDQKKVKDLETRSCEALLKMTHKTTSPSAQGKKHDRKAVLIFKVVCGPYHDDAQRDPSM